MFATDRLQDLAIEGVLRMWPEAGDQAGASYTLPPGIARRVTVRWPRVYEWSFADAWGDQYRHALERHVVVRTADVPQPFAGNIVTQFDIDGHSYDVAFDYSDDPLELNETCVKQCLVTFKAQHVRGGYGFPQVVPGGYIPGSELVYKMIPYLRWLSRARPPRFDVYGRFGTRFAAGVRGAATAGLRAAKRFRFEGGLEMVGYSRYLREVARSRVVVDLPGNGPFCFRLIEYFAIGACVVAYPHHAVMPTPLTDGAQLLYVREDLSDLEEQCERCLGDEALRAHLGAGAREYFDRYLHRDQLGPYLLASIWNRIARA